MNILSTSQGELHGRRADMAEIERSAERMLKLIGMLKALLWPVHLGPAKRGVDERAGHPRPSVA
ncbi:MAG: hypothetical protein AB7I79_09815 [Rhizobiaceae bacterium]